ncbi:MAG TPA: type I-E CRISPR-associated endonuclease Cas1e [Methanomassiliicoccales archaeon]|jgi:CRISPR-associated protein Cas1
MSQDLHELPKFRDGLSYLYLERCRVEQDEKSIASYDKEGVTKIPCASLAVIMLGPGAAISHEATKTIAQNGCLLIWTGEEGVRFYAQGMGETRSSYKLIRQAALVSDPVQRLNVVRKMYTMRFPGLEGIEDRSLEELRGMEGVRVRTAYAQASKKYGVVWAGRSYKREAWGSTDPINRALSSANSCLYGICHAAIVSAGYSPALGFIHNGKQLSFVYDIADLYKTETTIPVAFMATAVGSEDLERRIRLELRNSFKEHRILARIVDDINELMGEVTVSKENDNFSDDAARPAPLWHEDEEELSERMGNADHDS